MMVVQYIQGVRPSPALAAMNRLTDACVRIEARRERCLGWQKFEMLQATLEALHQPKTTLTLEVARSYFRLTFTADPLSGKVALRA